MTTILIAAITVGAMAGLLGFSWGRVFGSKKLDEECVASLSDSAAAMSKANDTIKALQREVAQTGELATERERARTVLSNKNAELIQTNNGLRDTANTLRGEVERLRPLAEYGRKHREKADAAVAKRKVARAATRAEKQAVVAPPPPKTPAPTAKKPRNRLSRAERLALKAA